MSDKSNNSLINLDITKPADTLIKKVSNAVGGIFAPYQIKRIAKAEAEATIIKAQAEILVDELRDRAKRRCIEEETRKQRNMEDIIQQAMPYLTEQSDAEKIEDDWVTNFFDKSRIVSDREMQGLWARILAGEANCPGTYSRRTVNFLSNLDKFEADLFTKLCGFGWLFDIIEPLVFDVQAEIYNRQGINFDTLSHLESIGLIQFNNVVGFHKIKLPGKFILHYFGEPLSLKMQKAENNVLPIGRVILTRIGQELSPICGSMPVEGFIDFVKERWKSFLNL